MLEKEKNTDKKEIAELPKLKAFDKEYFYSFSWRDVMIDLILILFSFFVSIEFFSESEIFKGLKTWQTLAMYCAVVLTMPYYLGYLYVKNSSYFSKATMKVQLWIFVLTTLMVLVNLVRLTLNMDNIENPLHDVTGFFSVFAMFLLVLGPMMSIAGASQAYQEGTSKKANVYSFNPDSFASGGAFFMIILAIAFMIYFIGLFPSESSGWAAVVGMFAGPFAAVIVFAILMGLFTLLDKIGVYSIMIRVSKIVFPLIIISTLVFWAGISLHFIQHDFGDTQGKIPLARMVFALIISGIIPFRLITLFNPPWRLYNIVIGVLSLLYFIFKLGEIVF